MVVCDKNQDTNWNTDPEEKGALLMPTGVQIGGWTAISSDTPPYGGVTFLPPKWTSFGASNEDQFPAVDVNRPWCYPG